MEMKIKGYLDKNGYTYNEVDNKIIVVCDAIDITFEIDFNRCFVYVTSKNNVTIGYGQYKQAKRAIDYAFKFNN